jgi:nucleotide-binding universal stress UspA family protein
VATVTTARSERSVGSFPDRRRRKLEHAMSFSTIMVHVDVERDSDQRVQVALALADRFQATLIGVAGCALWPAFMAGDVALTESNQYDLQKVTGRFEQRGKTFRAQGRSLTQIEWRSALEPPGELLLREARAADLLIIGRKHSENDADPGVIVLRAGRPVLLVPDTVAALPLRRVVVAWKDTRECRRAVRDALPFLQQAKEVVLVEIGEDESQSQVKKNLADVAAYLVRHQVIVAAEVYRRPRGPAAAELLHVAQEEKADLIVAGGYGHSRLGEWIFGGVTRELLSASPVCCLLSH